MTISSPRRTPSLRLAGALLLLALLLPATAALAQVAPTLVRDIMPGSDSSDPEELTLLGNTFYFSADDGTSGNELW